MDQDKKLELNVYIRISHIVTISHIAFATANTNPG